MEYNNVVVYVDERLQSETAILHANSLAQGTSSKVLLFDVLEALSELNNWPNAEDLESLRHLLVQNRTEWLRLQANRLNMQNTEALVKIGRTSTEIIRQVLRNGHDLVIKTARGRSDGRRISFGSTGMHLIRKCPCPVWLVAPETPPPLRRVMAAVNPVGAGNAPLAMKVLAHAAALADKFNADLHVLHAWHPQAESLLRSNVTTDAVTRYVESTFEQARKSLALLIREAALELPPSRVHLLLGSAVETISMAVQAQKIDTLVMGTVAGNLRASQLIGSVAEETLSRIDCSVLCVKPDGFVSPIRLDS
jgi:universal stress protein E